MRILWVEDFDEANPARICPNVFSGFLSAPLLSALVSTQVRGSDRDRPHGYNAWRKWYEERRTFTEPEIHIYRRYSDLQELVSTGSLSDRYDVVLLDVNLSNVFFLPPYPCEDLTKGGFWILNSLAHAVHKRFPSTRAALLTHHATETETVAFKEKYRREQGVPLQAFGKLNGKVAEWVSGLFTENKGFLNLRRGFLDGVSFAEKLLLDNPKDSIRFNRFSGNGTKQASKDEIAAHLKKLKDAMPDYIHPSETVGKRLSGFRGALAELWEGATPGSRQGPDDFIYLLGWVMKNLRNWSAHQAPLDDCDTNHMAFLVLAYFRTTIQLGENLRDDELRSYEHHLISVMGNPGPLDHEAASQFRNERYRSARSHLHQVVKDKQQSRHRRNGSYDLKGDVKTYGEIANELEHAERHPEGFSFAEALGLLFVTPIQCTRNSDEFRAGWASFQGWVKAVLARLLNPPRNER